MVWYLSSGSLGGILSVRCTRLLPGGRLPQGRWRGPEWLLLEVSGPILRSMSAIEIYRQQLRQEHTDPPARLDCRSAT